MSRESGAETAAGPGTCPVRWRYWLGWTLLVLITAGWFIAAAAWSRFPGDLALSRWIQSLSGPSKGWAEAVTNLVRFPQVWWLIGTGAIAAWLLRGWRAALAVPAGFALVYYGELPLKKLVQRPRPAADLVDVAGSPSGFSFPSGYGLITGAVLIFIAVLAWQRLGGPARWLAVGGCAVLLLFGGSARITLGAHWPSDLMGAWLLAAVWSLLAAAFVPAHSCRRP